MQPGPPHREMIVDLEIGADEFLRLYRGQASGVVARARHGQTVRFPAKVLRGFVTRGGVSGTFRLTVSADDKLISIERV